jgi:hypothetical protein
VVNLGANGFGTDQQYLMWLAEGVRLRPRTVVLGFFVPDFYRNELSIRELPKPRFRVEPDGALTLTGVPVPRIGEFLADTKEASAAGLRTLQLATRVWQSVSGTEGLQDFEARARLCRGILLELEASVRAEGAELVVMVIPHAKLAAYAPHQRILEVVRDALHEDSSLIDLTPTLHEYSQDSPGEALYGSNEHWTPLGHRIAAQVLHEHLDGRRRGK